MYIELLDQDLTIASHEEALLLHQNGHAKWNVLSISDKIALERPYFPNAQRVMNLFFDDVETDSPPDCHYAATPEDIQLAISFAREIGNEPLLIHCYAGVSRSTALAWLIAYDRLKERPDAVRRSFEIVHELRPAMRPNRHILTLGIELLVPAPDREEIQQLFLECLGELDE
jgi:predicted protein tyrosine phosphatase